jgi:hypothetical protein
MRYDNTKIDEAVLAVLYLTAHDDHGAVRAWKSIDWEAMNRLFEADCIGDPRNANKSVLLTPEGVARAQAAAERLFGVQG